MKQLKEALKCKKDSMKMQRQLYDLNNFISKKFKHDIYNDKTYDGIIPQHISKKLKAKRSAKSKTPRGFAEKGKLAMAEVFDKSPKGRASTAAGFYPGESKPGPAAFNISPKIQNKNPKQKNNFQSYDDFTNMMSMKNLKENNNPNEDIEPATRFKLNPSPYKRRERSISELVQQVQEDIKQLEIIKASEINKHLNGPKPKSKLTKKKKKKKARSHSPKETTKQMKKNMMAFPNIQKQILKSIQKNEMKVQNVKVKKPNKGHITSRNKKTNSTTIEGENRPLKMKSITHIKDKGSKKLHKKSGSTVKKQKNK